MSLSRVSAQRAGRSAVAAFRRSRRRAIRRNWRDWVQLLGIGAACIAALALLGGSAQLVAAGVLGFAVAIGLVGWEIGGDAHLLPWLWGVVGERQTESVLEQLGSEWLCVHDVP